MSKEIGKEIRRAVDTGKVLFGTKSCLKEMSKNNGELIVISNNIPVLEKEKLKHFAEIENKKIIDFEKNGLALGSICGKPFVISALIILDKGKSKIMDSE